ncbi:MAG: tetratricopeptide repeat protein, partial [Bacteroidota bacterium]
MNLITSINNCKKISYAYYLTFSFILIAISVSGQKPERWIKLGDEAYAQNDFYGAFFYYQNAIAQDSITAEFQYKYAEAARGINNYELAARYYQKVYKKERGRFYPDGPFHLANMYKYTGDYKNALKYWRKAKSKRKKDSYIYKKAIQEYKSTQWANLEKNRIDEHIEIKSLPSAINSVNSEFAGILNVDSSFIFSALPQKTSPTGKLVEEKRTIKLYQSSLYGEDEWKEREPISIEETFKDKQIGNTSIDRENGLIYFSVCDSICKIYQGNIHDSQIVNAKKLNQNINNKFSSNTQAHYSKDDKGEYLYFVSDRIGGEGGLDIWRSQK